uniref:Uncharacterized protein n=1 Tax=Arundo donax TaxID=35708 RepID=A0A0A9FZ68_ARUDO
MTRPSPASYRSSSPPTRAPAAASASSLTTSTTVPPPWGNGSSHLPSRTSRSLRSAFLHRLSSASRPPSASPPSAKPTSPTAPLKRFSAQALQISPFQGSHCTA